MTRTRNQRRQRREPWLAETPAGILFGRLAEREAVMQLLVDKPGFVVISADPMSGTSAVLADAAGDASGCVLVDARGCSDELDLAMAITDAAIAEFHPDAYGWWTSDQISVADGGSAALNLMRDLGEFRGFGVDIENLRWGRGEEGAGFEDALRVAASRTREPVTLLLDHFGLLAAAIGPKRTRALLSTIRAVSQEAVDLNVICVEFPEGPASLALDDEEHPLYRFGRQLRITRAKPNQIVASMAIGPAWTDVPENVLGGAAELAAGVPALTWRIAQLADDSPDGHAAAYAGWQALRHYSAPETARLWNSLHAVHPRAQWVVTALATGTPPHQLQANPKSIDTALRALQDLGHAWRLEPGRWALADPLLAAWAREYGPRRRTRRPAR